LTVNLAAAQTANAFDVTSNGGTAGDLFNVAADGGVFVAEGSTTGRITLGSNVNTYVIGESNGDLGLYTATGLIRIDGSTTKIGSNTILMAGAWTKLTSTGSGSTAYLSISANSTTTVARFPKEGTQLFVATDFIALEGTAKITRKSVSEVHTLALATTSDTTTISIPSGSRLLAVQMNVDVAVTDDAGDDTWSAAFVTGSTTTVVSGAAAALNTKVDFMVPDEITSGIAEIRFTPNGGSFSAGQIEVLAYYETLTSMANA
jgi:hypothetical protein